MREILTATSTFAKVNRAAGAPAVQLRGSPKNIAAAESKIRVLLKEAVRRARGRALSGPATAWMAFCGQARSFDAR